MREFLLSVCAAEQANTGNVWRKQNGYVGAGKDGKGGVQWNIGGHFISVCFVHLSIFPLFFANRIKFYLSCPFFRKNLGHGLNIFFKTHYLSIIIMKIQLSIKLQGECCSFIWDAFVDDWTVKTQKINRLKYAQSLVIWNIKEEFFVCFFYWQVYACRLRKS